MGEPRVRFSLEWTRASCQDNGATDPEREKRWAELFDQLDLNKDGRIDVNELRTGLAAWGIRGDVEEVRQTVSSGLIFCLAIGNLYFNDLIFLSSMF